MSTEVAGISKALAGDKNLVEFWEQGPRFCEHIEGHRLIFSDDFTGEGLSTERWWPYHLPHWSSRQRSRARYRMADSSIVLFVDDGQGPWCPEFDGGVRVSALQTGQFAGNVGQDIGQHRFKTGVRVRESQVTQRLYTPLYGYIVMRARARMAHGSLASLYLIGFEDEPQHSGEITVMEVFGRNVHADGAILGRGIKSINDKSLKNDFIETKLPINISEWHNYSINWTPDGILFLLDDKIITRLDHAPHYNMQLMLTFYQLDCFHDSHDGEAAHFEIDYVRGYVRSH